LKNRTKLGLIAGVLVPLALSASARAAQPPSAPSPNGPHGCFLQDGAGTTTPVVHSSDTSTIGGNTCTYTQVDTNEPTGVGGSYFAAAQSWSIKTYVLTMVKGVQVRTLDPAHSFSSAAGSGPVGQHVIPVGEQADVTVSNGAIVVGTPNGAPGA
jgi:hypothetical protein